MIDISERVKERDEALLSFDEKKIREYFKKYDIETTYHMKTFWASVYKSVLYLNSATDEQKSKATLWLVENGFSPFIRQGGQIMQDYTILATEPHSDKIIKMYASNEQDYNQYIGEMKDAGYRDIFAVEVVR